MTPHVPKPAELADLEQLLEEGRGLIEARVVCEVRSGTDCYPVYAIAFGSTDPSCPAVGFFGGIHGLERIGAEVVLAYLRSLIRRLRWDDVLGRKLESLRLVFMPVVNPGGLADRKSVV
jgi:murein tripeptide amidase MpaA